MLLEANKKIQLYRTGTSKDNKCMWCINFKSFDGIGWSCKIGGFDIISLGTCNKFEWGK